MASGIDCLAIGTVLQSSNVSGHPASGSADRATLLLLVRANWRPTGIRSGPVYGQMLVTH